MRFCNFGLLGFIMKENPEIKFLTEANKELNRIYNKYPSPDNIKKWKDNVLPKLSGSAKIKVSRVEVIKPPQSSYDFTMDKDEHEKKIVETVLQDTAFKINADKKSKKHRNSKAFKSKRRKYRF